jgi:hypothetical protein
MFDILAHLLLNTSSWHGTQLSTRTTLRLRLPFLLAESCACDGDPMYLTRVLQIPSSYRVFVAVTSGDMPYADQREFLFF